MKKFKIVLTKVPQGAPTKLHQRVEVTAAEAETLEAAGHEYVLAAEWDANKRVEASEAATKAAAEKAVQGAIDRAIKNKVLAPKDDRIVTIQASALKMEMAEIGMGVEYLDSVLKPDVQANDPLSGRKTSSQDKDGNTRIFRGEVTASEAAEGYIKASQPSNAGVRSGRWNDIFVESKKAGIILKELVKAGGEDMCLSQVVKGASSDPMLLFKSLEDGFVKADYTDPNTQVGILNTGLVLMRNLGFLKNKLNFMKYITTDLRNEAAMFGQAVNTRYIVVPGVLTFVPGVGFTSDATAIAAASAGTNQSGATTQASGTVTKSAPSTPDVTVTLNQFKGVEIEFPITTIAGTVRNLFAEQRGAQTYALAEHINLKYLATLFAATWTGTVNKLSLGSFALPGMIRIKNRMTLAKIPDIGRYALLHSFYHDGLLTDANLLSAKAILALLNKDASSFESGEVPELFGVKPLESQLASYQNGVFAAPAISADGSAVDFSGTNQVGFAGNMSSALFVARVPQDFNKAASDLGIPATNAVEVITDPDSNLSVMVFKYVNNGTMSISVRMCLMYGFAQGDPRQGIVLTP
jgi:hypothetical protein